MSVSTEVKLIDHGPYISVIGCCGEGTDTISALQLSDEAKWAVLKCLSAKIRGRQFRQDGKLTYVSGCAESSGIPMLFRTTFQLTAYEEPVDIDTVATESLDMLGYISVKDETLDNYEMDLMYND